MTLGELIKKKRVDAGLTQSELAIASGINVGTVKSIEQGARPDPQFSTIQAIAKALGVTCHELTVPAAKPSRKK